MEQPDRTHAADDKDPDARRIALSVQNHVAITNTPTAARARGDAVDPIQKTRVGQLTGPLNSTACEPTTPELG